MNVLREEIGQLFMIGVEGEALNGEERLIIEQCGFGGFILFSHNCREPKQILSLCRALWETGTVLPPFIAIDQEGGGVHRLPEPFTHFPAAARIGATGRSKTAYRAGRATAAELSLLGINLNFAPVLDVNSNPENPIIGDRAFGAAPEQVIRFAWPYAQGLRDGGIIPCGKHFPGHGDTDKDSHLALPIVEKSVAELKTVELPPFLHACRQGIEMLMTAHVLYRALDQEFPATLSEKIVTGLLRQDLGYDGVVFGDDIEMKAISANYGEDEAASLAVRAGVNVLLYCHDLPKALRAFEFLCAQAEKHPSLRARVEESYRRITQLKNRRLRAFTGVDETELSKRLALLDHQHLVEEIQSSL
ncbi:MAG: beta-N-acetylhexosaminidase [Deltaproteobacteria bacterium]|nr:beta-N-acetylhexosaminidase [Deltaproteobacteria bacterium]